MDTYINTSIHTHIHYLRVHGRVVYRDKQILRVVHVEVNLDTGQLRDQPGQRVRWVRGIM